MKIDDLSVRVRPLAMGWVLDTDAGVQPLMFMSGAKAEAHAHALAQCLAEMGADSCVMVHDRGERLVGTTRYLAAPCAYA